MGTNGGLRPSDEELAALSNRQLLKHYRAAGRQVTEDAELLDRLVLELIHRWPGESAFWYDRGMYAKWRRDWPVSVNCSEQALDLIPPGQRAEEPAAWNLAIAATARHDWPRARRGWTEYGVAIPDGDPDEPIAADFGPSPVRLNPVPRHAGEPRLAIDGNEYDTETVWGRRLDPARIQILNVPTPDSGHRYGDIVLHDGDTLGSRALGQQNLGVFNEIALWERSPFPTLTAQVVAPAEPAVDELIRLVEAEGGAAENWTQSMRVLCRACSEGVPGQLHDHGHGPEADPGTTLRALGLSGDPDRIRSLLSRWQDAGPGRDVTAVEIALP